MSKKQKQFRYYQIIIPHVHPYVELNRWPTFLGNFIMKFRENRIKEGIKKENWDDLYWFSYYGDFAQFQVYSDEIQEVEKLVNKMVSEFGSSFRMAEGGKRWGEDTTLEIDLGGERFLGMERRVRGEVTPTERGEKVLKMLHAGCELFLDTLIKEGDQWREEVCESIQNPYGRSSRSYIHLLHNFCQSPVELVVFKDLQGKSHNMSEYYFSHYEFDMAKKGFPVEVVDRQPLNV